MTPFLSEFLGTMILLLLGNGVVANVVLDQTKGRNSGWIAITTGWSLAVFMGVVVAGPVSGAHLNPAVTLALALAGSFPWADAPAFILAQLLGAMAGAGLVWLAYRDHYAETADPSAVLGSFCTGPAIRRPLSNTVSEIIGTFALVFVIFFFTGAEITDSGAPIGLGSVGALPVAFLVWAVGLSLGGPTGYAINPARDLGPRIMHALLPIPAKGSSDWEYAWIPVVGPVIGGVLAALLAGAVMP